ncbi:transcription termination factor NusA [Elizabethkingia sp. HX WHF]|uniref:Transcription termination/antitermination protein NusA n=3 Tax=Elizabethkingia TaxID=308865 RepID=A0AAP1G369_ELIMR|nr:MULTISPECIES: transcription termination factor NusA [Elizabethkingia]MCP1250574.1 transcription termination factor NusA [Elizabethkingia sp. S0634]MDR2230517.1 transcription termination factor NusA [Flavobacteriaceae bacterium]AQX10721.1 transcription termination/antitermination protein NusA [Elizabethkingia ursingii]AQX87485.1 transcription termination/antitermination protein NusA [Elizabethkingia bruuniana]ATL45602.1 transcription termination/antitermination protein NusA [Elizabethkingia 
MNNIALIESFGDFKDEKGISKIDLMAIIEDSLKTLLRKRYDSDDHFDVIVNPDKGDFQIFLNKRIVEDEMSEDDDLEIEISEAKKIDPTFEVGEEFTQEIPVAQLGRRNILTLKQILATKLQEHNNAMLYDQFRDRIGEIAVGEVHHIRHKHVILLDDEGNEFILPKENQIPSDFFRKGDSVRAVIESVDFKGSKPQIIVSRTAPKFLEKLLELEIPEIQDGTIILKKVVRIPGEKAKIAVDAYDDRIDPVGACVGVKGSRIHGVVRELRNENIDVIQWSKNPEILVKRALGNVNIQKADMNEEQSHALVYAPAEEISKIIGKQGQNIRLASWLTGYNIDVYRDKEEGDDVELVEFADEIEEWIINEFKKVGLDTARSVLDKETAALVGMTDLELETIEEVKQILRDELDD